MTTTASRPTTTTVRLERAAGMLTLTMVWSYVAQDLAAAGRGLEVSAVSNAGCFRVDNATAAVTVLATGDHTVTVRRYRYGTREVIRTIDARDARAAADAVLALA